MAYATKYLFKWQSANGTTREIRVLKNGYSGSVLQRHLGRAPILKKQKNGTVFGTSLEFYAECRVDGEFAEFYTTNPKAYKVELYAGSTLLWTGYVTPELYSEPDIAPPYDVQVIATDGIGELKLYDFEAQGTRTLRQMFTYLLYETGLGTDVYLISSLKAGSSGAGALLEKTINLDYMVGKNCYEVLTYLLDTLHATITWWKGAWIVARETNVTFQNGKVKYFNTAGNAAQLAGSVVTLGKMYSNDAWPVGQLTQKVDPAKKSVTVQAPWHPITCLANPDMSSDTGWTKYQNISYVTDKYVVPGDGYGGLVQQLSMAGMRVPMSISLKATGYQPRWQGSIYLGGVIGILLVYQVGNTTYLLRKGDDEAPTWKKETLSYIGNLPDGRFVDYQQKLSTVETSRIESEELSIENIPAFSQNGTFPSGTLTVYVLGSACWLYEAYLDIIVPKGYQDRLHLDNGARGEGDTVEIAIGRETSDIDYYKAFLQGILLDSGSLITSFKDDYLTSGTDFLSFISRDYARSFALPRIVRSGTVNLESAVAFPPLVFTKGAVDYWLETWSWNMYDDELDISARSIPTASITVDSEVISESSGSAASSSQAGGGSSSMGGGGSSFFEHDPDVEDGVSLKESYESLRAPKYYFTPEILFSYEEVNGIPTVRLNAALVTTGDQVLGDGDPGGGEPTGASYLHELLDVNISNPTNRQVLTYNATLQKWVNADAPEDSVQSVAGVSPDADGDVPVADIKTALGLHSAAYRDETYFATANDLTVVSGALQSLQAQIDAVASRDCFDEILATDVVSDLVSTSELYADNAHANRLYLTDEVYLYAETVNGVPTVRLNAAFVTAGDQVLGDGDPGGGGGGSVTYLYELMDVDDDLNAPSAGTLLQWYSNKWIGTTFSGIANGDLLTYSSGKWTNVARTSVGIVTDATQSAHGLMSATDKTKLDGINTTYIANGETAYEALTTIGSSLQSLQAQIDSVASRDMFDELKAGAVFADIIAASDIYAAMHGSLEGNADTATDADKLDGQHGSYYATASAVSTIQGYFTNGVANNADKLDGQHGSYYATAAAVTTLQGYFTNGVANDADKLDGVHASGLFTAMSSGAATNLSITIGGTNKTATLYATYDSASENISDKFTIVGSSLQSLQSQIDAVASRVDISDFEATTEAKMDYICDLMRSLQAQIDSVASRTEDMQSSNAYFDIISVGKAIYGDVLITTGDQTLSDERRKKITREIVLTAEQIASCRAVAFDWTDQPGSSFGSIAQDWQKILPESVSDRDDTLYLYYGQSAEVAVINLAREVVELKKVIEQLRKRNYGSR